MDSEEAKNCSEIIRTLTLVLSQFGFKKNFDEKINGNLKEIVTATLMQLKCLKDNAKIVYTLVEEGKFDEARERLLKISYELLRG
ncbi:hypothetical protein [Sulfurisphaera tokodaii]|uniref:Uncharacterized protein n=2 Tax=Sulfurisphaera tokodaii TaxID=111955 RepID=Q96Z41_SULTO|nr:hypothetical protein [Sulfurisphaera tokodaii]BAB67085.1 hypothetical protein STK_19915 [Sulfurisphaera tokodaii str. 7]HII73393.1 hypothetical protein [Sulfurisphaera tokodaii]